MTKETRRGKGKYFLWVFVLSRIDYGCTNSLSKSFENYCKSYPYLILCGNFGAITKLFAASEITFYKQYISGKIHWPKKVFAPLGFQLFSKTKYMSFESPYKERNSVWHYPEDGYAALTEKALLSLKVF